MPEFTVHEGGKSGEPEERPDFEAIKAQDAFEDLMIEVLRSLAKGEGAHRIGDALTRFIRAEEKSRTPYMGLIYKAVRALDERGFSDRDQDELDYHEDALIRVALKMAAEGMATDGLARARRSKARTVFDEQIKALIIERERRSRENGWSYVQHLTERRLGPWIQPKPVRPAKTTRKKASKPKPKARAKDIEL